MIRTAVTTDAQRIAHVHVRSWQQAYSALMPAGFLASLEATLPQRELLWTRTLEAGDTDVLVAEVDDQVVGWMSVGTSRDEGAAAQNTGEVMAIYVLAEHWGTGVGLALWKAGLRRLSARAHPRLTLWVLADNARAIRFYRKAGWAEEAGSQRTLVRGGMTLEEVRYGWSA